MKIKPGICVALLCVLCLGEVYTDMADLGFNCCPDDGGDCFPPIR